MTSDDDDVPIRVERAATVTLCIGQSGPQREDGTCATDLNLGKHRMGGGDKVIPASYNGRTGRWRITGPARPASEVRDERTAAQSSKAQAAAEARMNAAAERATAPLTRDELCTAARCKAAIARAGLTAMLERGDLVEVRLKQPRSKFWCPNTGRRLRHWPANERRTPSWALAPAWRPAARRARRPPRAEHRGRQRAPAAVECHHRHHRLLFVEQLLYPAQRSAQGLRIRAGSAQRERSLELGSDGIRYGLQRFRCISLHSAALHCA